MSLVTNKGVIGNLVLSSYYFYLFNLVGFVNLFN